MTDADDMYDINMRELDDVVLPDADETTEQHKSFSFHEAEDLDDIPPSLLSYFETSKSRATVCEKIFLEKHEEFTASHHAEDMVTLPSELDEDMMKLDKQVICDRENEENNTSTDTRLLPAPTVTEALFTHNVSVYPNNEDEAGMDDYMESEKHLAFQEGTIEISLNEEEINKSSDYKAEQDKVCCEEMKREEQKRHRERKFQEELKKIMEAEKLHQKELELMEKTAQEKLEQEFLLQQELITNLQRRVEEERRKREEEQKRMKDEEDKQKREEEKNKIDAERKRMEEETRRKKREEERKMEEARRKKEEERKNVEEKKKITEREEKRKRVEERNKVDLEKKKLEDEMRMMEEEEKRKKKEVERTKKEEEERKRIEEMRKEVENKRKRKTEKQTSLKEEEWQKKEEERKNREQTNMRTEEETEEKKKQEEMKRKEKEEEEADDRKNTAHKKMCEEMRMKNKEQHGYADKEIKLEDRKKKEEGDRKKRKEEEDDEKQEVRKREKERKKMEEKREVREVIRKQEGEDSNMEEELRPMEEDENRKKEEEQRRWQKDKMMRLTDEERKSEIMRLDKDGNKGHDADYRKMEQENKKIKEKKQEEEEKRKSVERKNAEAEKEQNGEEVREVRETKKTEEETQLRETEESKKRTPAQGKEVRINDVPEKKENENMVGQNEKNNFDKTENSSQLKDCHTRTSSSPGPLHGASTTCYTSTEAKPQQHDLHKNVSQTSPDKNQEVTSSTPSLLPVCLPEHTEQKRLSWMNDCVSWTKLSLQNRRKQKRSVQSHRGPRRAAEASSLPPLCPDFLLQSTGWKSLQQVTMLTLEDLPGCSLSTLAQCTQLQSLSLRCCGLKSLEGLNHLSQLCYIDVQDNDISFIACENMTSLRVLQLSHNKLTSIHGLTGAENLDVLDLSHNFITRIAGLESVRRLQRLSVDHNQLISTKGLRDVYTLLHLNCSHNHLANVEGLENSALLNTLDLRANSLTELPRLNDHVLLRELHLDDNSISSLQGLTACWLPLMQHFSVAQNRITQLPSMSDCVSLANLDLRFNCISELQNVCVSLEGCHFLQEVHLTGNPLQQESGWGSALQKAVPSLRFIDGQETDSFLSPPTVQQVSLASGNFLMFCQAQLQQTHDLQQQHSREHSDASSPLDAAKTSCRHFTEALQLATDQRFAHEYGDTTVADKHTAAVQTVPEETLDMDRANAEKQAERPEMDSTVKVPAVISNRDDIRCSDRTIDEKSAAESQHDTLYTVTTGSRTVPTVWKANSGSVHSLDTKRKTVAKHQNLDLQNTAAVVIQHLWKKYREKCGNISSPSTAEKGGGGGGGGVDGEKPESGPSYINGSVVGQDYAATVIQAFWRGFSLRKRLTSALAAVTCPDTGEDDTFEEVDVDEFVFDEETLEKHWSLLLSEDSPPRCCPVSEQLLSVKPPGAFPDPSQYAVPLPLVRNSKLAWVDEELVDSAGHRVSPPSSNRSKSPASASVISGLSERSEKILEEWGFTHHHTALLMLKRAQNMKSKKQQQKKYRDPSVRLAWFKNQLGPVEARSRQAQHNRNYTKAREAEVGLQQAEKTEQVKQERAQQWLHTQAAHSDRDSESEHFLPEISSDVLNGGRVQLVADPGYTEHLHHASGLWANSSSAAQPCKQNSYLRKNCLGHTREVPSPKRVTSAPSKKERISFRDNPVQMSGGWGGGKKRDKVYK